MIDAARSFDLYLNGAWQHSQSPHRIERRHPGNGQRVATYAQGNTADIDNAVAGARAAFNGSWRTLSQAQRAELLLAASVILQTRSEEFARVEADETGKPFSDALSDLRNGIALWRYAASILRARHGELHADLGQDTIGMTLTEPVGVVGLITPWNFPFIVAAERLPFMLAAGCTVVCKPSEYASGTALLTAEVLTQAGFPPGVMNVVTGLGSETGAPLVAHEHVAMISFTGSTANGRQVMAAAAPTLKRLSLELGGKSPILVFADADFERAVDAVISGFTHNAGQCCIATTRLLVERSAAINFEIKLVDKLRQRFGKSIPQAVANRSQFDRVASMVLEGAETSRRAFGANAGDGNNGFYLTPSVFADLPPDSPVLHEEIFGPVLSLQTFDEEAEAIALANDTEFGLAAAIWTEDQRRAMRCARRIRAGRIWINAPQDNYPELPVGGFGASGMGREAGSSGIATYSETKTVIMR